MTIDRLWILYKPRLYRELFKRLFQSVTTLEIIEGTTTISLFSRGKAGTGRGMDIILLPLNESGDPDMEMLPAPPPYAKLIAFSPTGERGLRRLPGETEWEEVRPYGLGQLLLELGTAAFGRSI